MDEYRMVFDIKGMNGAVDYRIPIEGGRLVLVGDNGSGKTTLCQMIQLFLSGNWHYLARREHRLTSDHEPHFS